MSSNSSTADLPPANVDAQPSKARRKGVLVVGFSPCRRRARSPHGSTGSAASALCNSTCSPDPGEAHNVTDPTLIATLPKSRREEVRVRLGEYHGHRFADVRIYVDAPQADRATLGRIPTRKGIAVPVAALPDLINALRKAHAVEMQRQRREAANQNPAPKTTRRKAR